MTLTILRGKAVVTTVTLTYDEAHWTPFEGEEKLAGLLRGCTGPTNAITPLMMYTQSYSVMFAGRIF